MSKTAFLFPGQGAQYVGMGKELYQGYPIVRETLDKINSSLGNDLLGIIMNGPEEELTLTENTQPAILAMSIAIYNLVSEAGIKASAAVGLSLGEYSALTASGVLKFEDALPLVRKRGRFMQEAVPEGTGTMAAIIGLSNEDVISVTQEASVYGIVEAVNFNCPGQVSVAGEIKAVEKAVEIAKAKGASRALILKVSAPFHCRMLEPAGHRLKQELIKIEYSKGSMDVISNVDAQYYNFEKDIIVDRLSRQVYNPVLFENSVIRLLNDGYDTFIELGPGKALSGFMKRIDKSVNIYNVEDKSSLEKLMARGI